MIQESRGVFSRLARAGALALGLALAAGAVHAAPTAQPIVDASAIAEGSSKFFRDRDSGDEHVVDL